MANPIIEKNNDLFDFIVTPKRVFLVDYSVFVHRGIFAWRNNKQIPATYYTLNSILTCLKLVKPKKDDLIIFAIDSYGKGNWRKDYDPAYKANRRESRDKQEDIDWADQFSKMNKLLENINYSTPFIPIQIDRLEADDIISYTCRYFKDRACIILTTDSDMNQLYALGNTKVFSPVSKKFKEVKNPLGELAKKIKKETTDNLITPVTNEIEFERRKAIVSLLKLPPEIDSALHNVIKDIEPKKTWHEDSIMFKSLIAKFKTIYID